MYISIKRFILFFCLFFLSLKSQKIYQIFKYDLSSLLNFAFLFLAFILKAKRLERKYDNITVWQTCDFPLLFFFHLFLLSSPFLKFFLFDDITLFHCLPHRPHRFCLFFFSYGFPLSVANFGFYWTVIVTGGGVSYLFCWHIQIISTNILCLGHKKYRCQLNRTFRANWRLQKGKCVGKELFAHKSFFWRFVWGQFWDNKSIHTKKKRERRERQSGS